jgi:hypothetical protein
MGAMRCALHIPCTRPIRVCLAAIPHSSGVRRTRVERFWAAVIWHGIRKRDDEWQWLFSFYPRSGLVHFLAVVLVGRGPLSCPVRLGAPLATGKFTTLVRVCTAGGTPHSEYLFLSKLFRLHADYDATILSSSCVLSLIVSLVV